MLTIGYSEVAIHCKYAGKQVKDYNIVNSNTIDIILNNGERIVWDWGYRLMDNRIILL